MNDGMKEYYYSLDDFFSDLDRIVAPIIELSNLKEQHREELKDLGVLQESHPKWARRKRGEKRPSDRWDFGEKT